MTNKTFRIPPYVYFILATILIIVLFPREDKFKYTYNETRPWHYGLLTAPFDFSIDKTSEEIKQEQDSARLIVKPYFRIDNKILQDELTKLSSSNYPQMLLLSKNTKKTLENTLVDIYNKGIISDKAYEYMTENNRNSLMIFLDEAESQGKEVAGNRQLSDVYTINQAKELITKQTALPVDLKNLIQPNLIYDEAFTEKTLQSELQKVSPTSGMVQAGEKIIDRGEIVTPKIYRILNSLKKHYEQQVGSRQRQLGTFVGIFVLVGGLMACLLLYFYFFRKDIYKEQKNIIFMLSISTAFITLTELAISYKLFDVYIIPYAIIPVVILTFFDSRTAHITHLMTVTICSLIVADPFQFLLLQLIVCMVSLYVLKDLTQRSELVKCAFFILATYCILYTAYFYFQEGDITKINWHLFIYFGINFLFVMFTYPFIYIIEKVFGYISNVTLVELSDINRPALRELSEKCPGTFQHSLQVSMLGTAAAAKVNANPQLIRTGALYHDLGKMANPAFFTENKIGDNNPHSTLSLKESAKIITNHVPDGVKIAEKNNIPQAIIKFIQTHHGKGKAKYFYYTYLNQHPNEPVDEKDFSYDGSNPDTKETAILMMADSVEAASRSLKEYTEESIRNLVNKIIDGQITDGLMQEAPLTFKNITDIKEVFVEKLMSVYHSRISYPELNK